MSDKALEDENVVLFTGLPSIQPGEVELHSLADKVFGRRVEDVQADWRRISSQVAAMVDATSEREPEGFQVDSVEIGLGFSATGKLAFIAEAGVEASVTVTLSRKT